jgi:hypothetical protein
MTYEEFDAELKLLPGNHQRALQYCAEGGSVLDVANSLGVAASTLYSWRNKSVKFEELWQFAVDLGIKKAESTLCIGWMKSADDPRYFNYLKLYLAAHKPEKYGAKLEVTNATPQQEVLGVTLPPPKDE